jgi:hypothetical protein
MSARLFVWSSVAVLGLSLGAAVEGCELVVGDGTYKVGAASGSDVGTSGSTSGGASGSVSSGSSAPTPDCIACEQTTCSGQWTACQGNSACLSFSECEANCGTHPCTCEQDFPTGAALWLELNTCATSNCGPTNGGPCPAMGIGDPCMTDLDCAGNTTQCSNWCTQQCAVASDCAGQNINSANLFGQSNYCILNGDSVDSCFPGCTTNADCQSFPGTSCLTASPIDNPTANVNICSLPADAGTD